MKRLLGLIFALVLLGCGAGVEVNPERCAMAAVRCAADLAQACAPQDVESGNQEE